MSERDDLGAVLQDADYRLEQGNSISPPYVDRTLYGLTQAARRWFDLMPEPCTASSQMKDCPSCLGRGYLYKPETVERVANALAERERGLVTATLGWYREHAVAVLDSLMETP